MTSLPKLSFALCVLMLCTSCATQDSISDASVHAHQLERRFFAREYAQGYAEGLIAMSRFPQDSQIAAWFALNAARAKAEETAIATAETLVARDPSDVWAQFAKAGALLFVANRAEERIAAAAKVYEIDPERVEFVWIYAESLRLQQRFDEGLEILATHYVLVALNAQLLAVRASIRFDQFLRAPDKTELRRTALDDFATARKLDPANIDSYFSAAYFLLHTGSTADASDLLREGVAHTTSPQVRRYYWSSLASRPDWGVDARRAALRVEVDKLLTSGPREPDALMEAAEAYQILGDTAEAQKYQDEVIAIAQPGHAYDMARAQQFWPLMAEAGQNSAKRTALELEVANFLREPTLNSSARSQAAQVLLNLVMQDANVSPEILRTMTDSFERMADDFPTVIYLEIPRLLANRSLDLDRAERLALDGQKTFERQASNAAEDGLRERARALLGDIRATLGWIRFKQGRFDEAEKDLALAAKTPPEMNPFVYSHLSALYLSRNDRASADEYLQRCFEVLWTIPNPCEADLETSYRQTHDNENGMREWVAARTTELKGRRQTALAEKFERSTHAFRPFDLQSIGGTRIRSSDLKGKVLMVSFWGMWCGACMVELPELQRFVKKHENDDDFVMVTINNDKDLTALRKLVKEKQLEFPIALDDGYAQKAGVTMFPTAWFWSRKQDRRIELKGLTPDLERELELMLAVARENSTE